MLYSEATPFQLLADLHFRSADIKLMLSEAISDHCTDLKNMAGRFDRGEDRAACYNQEWSHNAVTHQSRQLLEGHRHLGGPGQLRPGQLDLAGVGGGVVCKIFNSSITVPSSWTWDTISGNGLSDISPPPHQGLRLVT